MAATKYKGRVKWFNNARGYGFIGRNDGEPDVFVHYSKIDGKGYRTLGEGDEVEFDIEMDNVKQRIQATRVVVAAAL